MAQHPSRPALGELRFSRYGEEPGREDVRLVPGPVRWIRQRVRKLPTLAIREERIEFRDEARRIGEAREQPFRVAWHEPQILVRIPLDVAPLKRGRRRRRERRWALQRTTGGGVPTECWLWLRWRRQPQTNDLVHGIRRSTITRMHLQPSNVHAGLAQVNGDSW